MKLNYQEKQPAFIAQGRRIMKSVEAINWTVKDLTTTYYGGIRSADPKLLVLPTYQRSYVWNLSQRFHLVDSLKQGWPVGALIVRSTGEYKDISENGNVKKVATYELIDGQQRSTSLILHSLFPLEILAVENSVKSENRESLNLFEEELDFANIRCDALQNRISEVLERSLGENWLKDKIRIQLTQCYKKTTFRSKDGASTAFTVKVLDKDKLEYTNFRNLLAPNLGLEISALSEIISVGSAEEANFVKFLKNIQRAFDIDNEVIPVIAWNGNREDAPSVFVRVNQGGIKLQKYQVLAASFAHSVTDIDKGIVFQLAEKVLRPKIGMGLLEQIPNDSDDLHIDLYAALIGLSQQLVEEHPAFFKKKAIPSIKTREEDDEIDEIIAGNHSRIEHYYAFNIVTLMMHLPLSLKGMQKLEAKIKEKVGADAEDRLNFGRIADAVAKASDFVCRKLEVFAKSTASGQMIFEGAHSELGFAALIARYALEFFEGRTPSGEAILGHYINDSIKGINEGAAHNDDYAAYTRVWATNPDGDESENEIGIMNSRYLTMIQRADLEETLNEWWKSSKQNASFRSSQRAVDRTQKMLLKLYARAKIKHARFVSIEKFEIDHSVPFSWIKNWESKNVNTYFGAGLIGNLAVLPRNVNSKKRDRTLDQYEDSGERQKDFPVDDLFELVPYDKGELKARGWSEVNGPSVDEFLVFVEGNWNIIKFKVLDIACDSTILG